MTLAPLGTEWRWTNSYPTHASDSLGSGVVGAIGPSRYGEIAATFGDVSSSTLSTRLDELVEAGYLSREQYDGIPPRVEYDLTSTGEQLCRRLEPLLQWVQEQEDGT